MAARRCRGRRHCGAKRARRSPRREREAGARARAFDPEMERAQLKRGRLETGLRAAIRDRRIGCAFQPKIDFRAGVVDSLEVLMRWRDEDGEWRSPGDFLDLAHSVGLTNDITRLVFEETLDSLDAISRDLSSGLEPRLQHLGAPGGRCALHARLRRRPRRGPAWRIASCSS